MLLLLAACTGSDGTALPDDTAADTGGTGDTDTDTDTDTRPSPPPRLSGDVEIGDGVALSGTVVGDGAGVSVAGAGDVNGDTEADVLVGAWHAADDAGQAYLHVGPVTTDRPLSAGYVIVTGDAAGDLAGWRVAGPGDLNGDGFADFVVAAPGADFTHTDAGGAGVFFGPLAGSVAISTAASPLWGSLDGDAFGTGAAATGDVNGDGLADFAIGAVGASEDKGRAYVYFGNASLGVAGGHAELTGEATGDAAGETVAGAGDFDGDGMADVAVGAPQAASDAGAVYVMGVTSAMAGSLADAPLKIAGPTRAHLGTALLGAVDVDGDGADDLLVGAPDYSGTLSLEGAVYVVAGGSTGALVADDLPKITGDVAMGLAGSSLAAADLDGDGGVDVAVGVPSASADDTRAYSGVVALLYAPFASVTGLTSATARLVGPDAQGFAGTSVANAGDTDGDTWDNLVVGVPGGSMSATYASAAYLLPAR